MNDFYLLIVGSRTFSNYIMLKESCDYLLSNHLNDNIIIVSGGARGADSLAEQYAKEKKYPLVIFKAQWNVYGKTAGYRRNVEMHKYISQFPNRGVVAFWDGQSKGTAHNFKLAKIYDNPIRTVRF